jgi:hypothetical protein
VPEAGGDVPVDWLITDRRIVHCEREDMGP